MRMLCALGHLRTSFPGSLLVLLLAISPVAIEGAAKPHTPASTSPALLPSGFAGWQIEAPAKESAEPAVADAANAQVLAECGFQQFASASYSTSGNTLNVRAMRFRDASGAYSAFTFYRRPGSVAEQIGRTGAWDGSHALFWTGNILVDATFGHLGAMSAAELRELAGDLPQPSESANIAPSLPGYLPRTDLDGGLTRYALGPVTYSRSGGVLPSAWVDFSSGSAEAVTATYTTRDGQGQLTLLDYPTPQLAAARMQAIDAFLKTGNTPQAPWPQELAESHPDSRLVRRSGPIIAITSGSLPAGTARKLINQINYQADVVWDNPQGYVGEGSKVARLLLGIAALFAIIGGTAILLGVFFGGGRALIRKLRGKPASSVSETEIIRLNLSGGPDKPDK